MSDNLKRVNTIFKKKLSVKKNKNRLSIIRNIMVNKKLNKNKKTNIAEKKNQVLINRRKKKVIIIRKKIKKIFLFKKKFRKKILIFEKKLLNHREKMNRSKLSKFLLIYKSTLKKKVLKPNKKYNKRSLNFFVKKFNLNKIKLLSLKTKKFRAVINYKYVKKIKINKKIFFKDSKIENLYFFNLACTQSIYLLKSFSIFYKLCFNVIMNFKTKLKAKKKKKIIYCGEKCKKN